MDVFVALVRSRSGWWSCFFGYRIFRLLLPLLGFFVGLIVGAQVVASIFGEGFLASIIGIVAGLVVGLLFGALAYVWWWLGVVLVFGGMGYALGAAIFPAIGIERRISQLRAGTRRRRRYSPSLPSCCGCRS